MADWITREIDLTLAGQGAAHPAWRLVVAEHRFLPLYLGWFGAIGLRPDGELVWWNEGDPRCIQRLPPGIWSRIALKQGAKKYPEAASLLPDRPRTAIDCRRCGGAGELRGMPDIICECGGMGWVIPGEPDGTSLVG